MTLVFGIVLDKVEHPADLFFREFTSHGYYYVLKRLFPGMLPENEMPFTSYKVRREVLIGRGVFKDGCNMYPALM